MKNLQTEALQYVKFGIFSPEQVKSLSVAKLTVPDTYNEDGYPIDGGLLDQRLGVIDPGLVCKTCAGRAKVCQGHFGHIDLVRPVIHSEFSKIIYMVLQSTCQKCHKILLSKEQTEALKKKVESDAAVEELTQLPMPQNKEADKKAVKKIKNIKKCPHCGAIQEKLSFSMPTYYYLGDRRLKPDEIREMLSKVSDEDLGYLGMKPQSGRPEWTILSTLLVPPVNVRPSITLETGERSEDDLTHKLVDIMRINQRLEQNINAGAPQIIIDDLWELLQYHITTYFNNETSGIPPARHRSGRALKTLTQRLKGKEGRFRYNLSGKRVNYSARAVLSGDPSLNIDEVGVPLSVAEKLTVPFYVTEWNLEKAKEILQATQYPMVVNVIGSDGKRKRVLDANREDLIKALAPLQILERQLQNGDIVLFNRQPSLHRISIMAHFVKVVPGKTFRMNGCSTDPYNADFDGDEMNLHVPQTLEAQAEAKYLMQVSEQIFSPRDGEAKINPQQDGIIGSFLLTLEDTYVTKIDAEYLLGSVGIIELPKPEKDGTYSGKSIFSMLIPKGISIEIPSKNGKVVVKNGALVEGVLDSVTMGNGSKLLAKIAEQYGNEVLKNFIFNSAKLTQAFCTMYGFTLGIKDYIISEKLVEERDKIISNAKKNTQELIDKYDANTLETLMGRTPQQSLEDMILAELQIERDKATNIINQYTDKRNAALMLANSGARGGKLNLEQISMFLGQQATAAGERMNRGYKTNRLLPHIKPNDKSAVARGFITSNFLEGLLPIEAIMHANGSRVSIVQKGTGPAKSGYISRKIMNSMQDYYVFPDLSVRDANNNIIETIYGTDGIDPVKVQLQHQLQEEK